jgi:muramoyltetrapeptide carboxypeptidase LdcA involved in peptidoglycan recycling
LLTKGDTVATISLSWGGAGELLHRYEIGKKQLQDTFGLRVVETKNALRSADYISKNPKARADDLMEAFSDKSIKAIISNIGGDDSIRTLPYTDLSIIRDNPKIFLGFSDSTVTHFACYKAGLTSFYGTSYSLVLQRTEACINTRSMTLRILYFLLTRSGEFYLMKLAGLPKGSTGMI